MAAPAIYPLLIVCLCAIARPSDGNAACGDFPIQEIQYFTRLGNNVLNCRRAHDPDNTIYIWKRLNPTDKAYYAINDPTVRINGPELEFDVTSVNVGFSCEIPVPGKISFFIFFTVIESQILQTNANAPDVYRTVHEYQDLSLKCTFQGVLRGDDIQLRWWKISAGDTVQVLDTQRVYTDSKGILHFASVWISDGLGARIPYWCTAYSRKLQTSLPGYRVYINVTHGTQIQRQPVLKYATSNLQARVNDTIFLECVFTGHNNVLDYKWYLPNLSEIRSGRMDRNMEILGRGQRLKIHGVSSSDEGYYYCGADSAAGESFRQGIHVAVTC